MMSRTSVRRCRVEDITAAAELKRAVEDATYASYGSPQEHSQSLERFCSVDYVRQLVDGTDVFLAVDEATGAPMGMVSVSRNTPDLTISSLYCLISGYGIGTSLLAAAIHGKPGNTLVAVEVFDLNDRGRAFFASFGLSATGETRPSESYGGLSLVRMTAYLDIVRQHLARHNGLAGAVDER